jgi:cell wall-associated NlpC family hydrolase
MRRLPILLAAAAILATTASTADAATRANWNLDQQEDVARARVLTRLEDGRFHGERPLTGAQLTAALGALASESGQPAVAGSSAATVSLTAFDARLVDQLGLADVAAHVQGVARGAGLNPPRSFGTEVVARFLGLRTNHPAQDDALELYPWEPITRAEAAHSLATILDSGGWAAGNARAQLSAFSLPAYGARTKRALRVAVSKIGMPYIWGGETDRASNSTFGPQAHGGYDCSGFVWRTFKLSGQPAGARIGGRTAAQMAGEIRKGERIHLEDVRPGDLIFFGSASFRSKATETGVDHVGIALSEHWMIHSSAQGVYVSSLDDEWRRDRFTWARRVL